MTLLQDFTKWIKEGKNFAFTKFGDSELLCMDGREGGNADHHRFSPDLCEALNQAFDELSIKPEVYFAEWTGTWQELYPHRNVNFVEYETMLPTMHNPDLKGLREFYKAIKESKRKKIYVAPSRSRPVIDLLGIDTFIEVPLINCWSEYEAVRIKCLEAYEPDCVYVFSCTMMANVLTALMYVNCTCLDIGSAFDPYCNIQNRDRQMTPLEAQRYFTKGILPSPSDTSNTYFVHIKNPRRLNEYYPAYNDYFRFVHLAEFKECDIEEVKPMSKNTYIFTLNYHGFNQEPIPDSYFPSNRTARMILHQLERYNIIDDRFDEIWLYDRSMPELAHPKAKYMILGGDKNFIREDTSIRKAYHFYHMCYLYGRRQPMIEQLKDFGYTFADQPIENWQTKEFLLQSAQAGIALHQHNDSLSLIEPLRYTVFACAKLPILAEKSIDPYPYYVYSYEQFLKDQNIKEITNWQDNYDLLTKEHTFKGEILKALKR